MFSGFYKPSTQMQLFIFMFMLLLFTSCTLKGASSYRALVSNTLESPTVLPVNFGLILAGGNSSTATPSISFKILSSITDDGITEFCVSEFPVIETCNWGYSASGLFAMSSLQGQKKIYSWIRNKIGISSRSTSTILLELGAAPTVNVTSPNSSLYPGNINAASPIQIQYTCTPGAGNGVALSATPISIDYTKDNGETYNTIEHQLANSGSYAWAFPSGIAASTSVRVRVSCVNQIGLTGSTLSSPINVTGNWNIWAGKTFDTYQASATNADLSEMMTAVQVKNGDIYYTNRKDFTPSYYLYKIVHSSGTVERFAGDGTWACSLGGTLSSSSKLGKPSIVALDYTDPNYFFFTTDKCDHLYRANSLTSEYEIWNSSFVFNHSYNWKIQWSSFITRDQKIYVSLPVSDNGTTPTSYNNVVYRLDISLKNQVPEQIIGNGTCNMGAPSSAGSLALNIGAPYSAGDNTCEIEQILVSSDHNTIIIASWGVSNHKFIYDEAQSAYVLAENNASNSGASFPLSGLFKCKRTLFDSMIYCGAKNSWAAGRTVHVFDGTTLAYQSSKTLDYPLNDSNYFLTITGESTSGILYFYSNRLYSVTPASIAADGVTTAYSIGGVTTSVAGNSDEENGGQLGSLAFSDVDTIHYNKATKTLWVSDARSVTRKLTFSSDGENAIPSNFSSKAWINSFQLSSNLVGTRAIHTEGCGAIVSTDITSASTNLTNSIIHSCYWGTPVGATYPAPDSYHPISAAPLYFNTGGVFRVEKNGIVSHSTGDTYFAAHSTDNSNKSYPIIYKINQTDTEAVRIAGKTNSAIGSYLGTDHGTNALSASFTRITVMQEIESGLYAGDLLVFDSDRLRRISVVTEALNPKIYDVLYFPLAPSNYTLDSTSSMVSAYYDSSSEVGGILGTGTLYYSYNNGVHYWKCNSYNSIVVGIGNSTDCLSATDYRYDFTGLPVAIPNTPSIALFGDLLLVAHKSLNQILSVPAAP